MLTVGPADGGDGLFGAGGGDIGAPGGVCSEFVAANVALVRLCSDDNCGCGGRFGSPPLGVGLNSHTSCPLLDTTPKCPSFGSKEFTEGMRSCPDEVTPDDSTGSVSASGFLGGGLPVCDRERVDEAYVCNGAG